MIENNEVILITGGAGLVGSILCKELLKQKSKYKIYVIDNKNPDMCYENISFACINICDYSSILEFIKEKEINVIIHLAAALESSSIDKINYVNRIGTNNIFKAALSCGIKRIIYASSVLVMYVYRLLKPYVDAHNNIPIKNFIKVTEKSKTITPKMNFEPDMYHKEYAESKLYGENLSKEYSTLHEISCIVIRFGWINKENKSYQAPNWCSHQTACKVLIDSIEKQNI
ncbi:NAD(P)-dependent oxidoreductase [Francisella sp. 19X1-34]|uniref:NAD-dependent epimerase/dehydratase family protein n=1 Tax=Francisella sp. 19X1-34 TaxID=3087177 RepID=UPI002E352867|nr:NAD(P)-dependent oxidoreductase [Francisella sp. 19X1-34]MED7788166.1 NAD(P)-dependent oxidoreductase [Francisella sp. 19X1-34]